MLDPYDPKSVAVPSCRRAAASAHPHDLRVSHVSILHDDDDDGDGDA